MRLPMPPLAAAFAAAALLSPFAAQAQSPAPSSSPAPAAQPASPSPSTISDQEITKTANAMQQVMTLRQTYTDRLSQAKPADRDRIAAQGETAMRQAVANQGLTVKRYDQILQTAENDPTVRAKLLSQVKPPSGVATPGASPAH
jgi:Domain of unknown function (DUF4168)